MSGSHRTSPRGVVRRRTSRAAGAAIASAAIALGPAAVAGAAVEVDQVQAAENGYVTWENLAKILSGSSKAQDSVLGVVAKPLPAGWVPTSTTAGGTTTTQVSYLEALGQAATMVVTPADTSGVPGLPGLAQAGTLPAQLLLGEPLLAEGVDGAAAAGKITAAVLALNGINGLTAAANTGADGVSAVPFLRPFVVVDHAGQITGIPSLGEALALLPSGTRTTTTWSNTVSWPLAQAGGTTWLLNDRLTVGGANSEQIKAALGKDLVVGGPLVVENGKDVVVYEKKCKFGICVDVPVGSKWTPSGGPNEVVYNPAEYVPGALNLVDGIDLAGFSVIKSGMGGNYFLPGDGKVGWLAQSTQVIIPAHGNTPAKVATVPIVAGGVAVPFDLLTVSGLYTPGIVTQSGQNVNATLGSRSFGLAIPRAGLGVQTTSFLENWHVGPDGINVNTGWTVLLPQTGGTGIPPIPLIYSLGAYNLGPNGFGISGPSLFGIGLPSFQVGDKPAAGGTGGAIGDAIGGFEIPTTLISLDPKTLFALAGITDPTGLGLTDPFGTAGKLLTPVYQGIVTPIATPVTQAGFDLGATAANKVGKHAAEGSGNVAEIVERVTGKVTDTANKIEPVVPEAPSTPLDDVTIEPVTDGVDAALDAAQGAGGQSGPAGGAAQADGPAVAPASEPEAETPASEPAEAPESPGAGDGASAAA